MKFTLIYNLQKLYLNNSIKYGDLSTLLKPNFFFFEKEIIVD